MLRPSALVLLALTLAACDASDPDPPGPVTFQGTEVEARGDATLSVQNGTLVVSGLDGARQGGFTVEGQPARVDVEIRPLAVPAGGSFGAVVETAAGTPVASIATESGADGLLDFQFDFGGALTLAIVRYRLRGEIVFERRLSIQGGRLSRAPSSGGKGSGSSGSTHVIRENGRYIVVADSDGDGGRVGDGGCPFFLVTPPPPFDAGFEAGICTDWVEIEPIVTTPMPEGRVSVVGRGVGSFTVESLAVQ